MTSSKIIEIAGVSKTYTYATSPAIQNVSLSVNAGDRLGLIGGNGSGKTTLMRLLMNFLRPDQGSISIDNSPDLEQQRALMGYIPERQTGLENFTPRELLRYSARMHNLDPANARPRIDELLKFGGIADVADNLVSEFSKGMAQRVLICNALLHQPSILLLDEPMSGLDTAGQNEVRDLLMKLTDRTMIYASHQLEEIERLCTSVAILHKGSIVHTLDIRDLQQEVYTIDVKAEDLANLSIDNLDARVVEKNENSARIEVNMHPDSMQAWLSDLDGREIKLKRLRSRSILESLYLTYINN